jgi:hypothetical protein
MLAFKVRQLLILVLIPQEPNVNGQVWYNNATYAFKISNFFATGAWATGGNLTTARDQLAGAGTQTAGLAFGGIIPPSTYNSSNRRI